MSSRFVWHDLMTPDPAAAKAFYQALFGWTIKAAPMGEYTYEMFENGGVGFGGVNQLDPSQGIPANWSVYLWNSDSIDDVCARITANGGTVVQPPFEIPTVGHMAVAQDPQGAFFNPFSSVDGSDQAPSMPTPKGGVSWHELLTTDPAAAASFYSAVEGVTSSIEDMGTGPYTILKNGEEMIAGIMGLPEGMSMPAWMIYFEITQDTMEAALAEVTRLGGTVGMGPMEIPNVGTIGAVADSTGAWFCLMKSAM